MGTNSDKRTRQRENREAVEQLRHQQAVKDRRRKALVGVALIAPILLTIGVVVALSRGGDESAKDKDNSDRKEATTTTAAQSKDPAAELPAPPTGQTLTEPTECPPETGADTRVQKFAGPPPECIDPAKTYTATFNTTEGTFTASLDAKTAPKAVNNFVVLSRYNFYNGVPFHRIVPGFVIQGGDGDGDPWGSNDLGYSFEDELPADSSAYTDYSLAMANSGPATNGSQFFVVLPGGGAQLGPSYTRFGEVTDGREVVDAIGKLGNMAQEPTKAVVINSVTISTQ